MGFLLFSAAASGGAAQMYQATYMGDFYAQAVNNSAVVVGRTNGDSVAVRWTNGSLVTLPGNPYSVAYDVNSSGVMAAAVWGTSFPDNYVASYGNGTWNPIAVPGATGSSAAGINDSGAVLVSALNQAWIYNGSTVTNLGTLGGSYTSAGGINNLGHATGASTLSGFDYRAFLWNGASMQNLGSLGGLSIGVAINDSDQVTGYSSNGSYQEAFLYSGGSMTGLGTLGGSFSVGTALNNSGTVVGYAYDAGGRARAFVYSGGVMYDLNSLATVGIAEGALLYDAQGINDSGQIIVNALAADGESSLGAYLLTPVSAEATPEPGTTVLVVAGLCAALLLKRAPVS